MRYLVLALLFTGCSTTAPAPDLGAHALADVACTAQLAQALASLMGDPVIVQGTHPGATAVQVLGAVSQAGASNVSVGALEACKDTLTYAGEDAKKINAAIKAKIAERKAGK